MKITSKLLLGLALFQAAAYAQEPRIEVIDGKISISAQAVPLGRFLALFDKAMGTKSEVGPEHQNRNVSVQLTDLNFNDAVRKIFQGQPYNYLVTQGKGIKILGLADAAATGAVASQPSFSSSPTFNAPPPPQMNNNPIQNSIQQPAAAANTIFGGQPTPNQNTPNPTTPLSGPGMIPPPLGSNPQPLGGNPLINPIGGGNSGGNVMPGAGAPAPVPPPAPGVLPGASPGATPGQIK
jgi:hypothetical protein